jgi:hypothetical protein
MGANAPIFQKHRKHNTQNWVNSCTGQVMSLGGSASNHNPTIEKTKCKSQAHGRFLGGSASNHNPTIEKHNRIEKNITPRGTNLKKYRAARDGREKISRHEGRTTRLWRNLGVARATIIPKLKNTQTEAEGSRQQPMQNLILNTRHLGREGNTLN